MCCADRSHEAEQLEDLPQSVLADLVQSQQSKMAAALAKRPIEDQPAPTEEQLQKLSDQEAALKRFAEAREQTQSTLAEWSRWRGGGRSNDILEDVTFLVERNFHNLEATSESARVYFLGQPLGFFVEHHEV